MQTQALVKLMSPYTGVCHTNTAHTCANLILDKAAIAAEATQLYLFCRLATTCLHPICQGNTKTKQQRAAAAQSSPTKLSQKFNGNSAKARTRSAARAAVGDSNDSWKPTRQDRCVNVFWGGGGRVLIKV